MVGHFFKKKWHDEASEEQIQRAVNLVKAHCGICELPEFNGNRTKFLPVLKIRGLLIYVMITVGWKGRRRKVLSRGQCQ